MKELQLHNNSQIIIEYAKKSEGIEYNQLSRSLKGYISPAQCSIRMEK